MVLDMIGSFQRLMEISSLKSPNKVAINVSLGVVYNFLLKIGPILNYYCGVSEFSKVKDFI